MQEAAVFEQTYRNYLNDIGQIDYLSRATRLGVEVEGSCLIIPLYDRRYRLSPDGIAGQDGVEANPAVRVILCRYVLDCPAESAAGGRLMTYREFAGAGPLVSYFTSNTYKTIETHFSGRLDLLKRRAEQLGAVPSASDTYDLSLQFKALPRIPVILNFNDRDQQFPAVCSILYRESAQQFLDMECLAMTGTLLAGRLIAS